jgi:L,D-transpeptidase YcbB
MRVQYPDQYAEVLLRISQPEDGYTAQSIRSLYGRSERNVELKNPIPVYITTTAHLPAAHKIPREVFGWESRWDNYLQSRRSAYEPFGGFRSW